MIYTIVCLLSMTYLSLLFRLYVTWIADRSTTYFPLKQNYSILVPVRNEATNIEQCLASIFAQNYSQEYEVILIDDHSEDETLSIAKRYPRLIIHIVKGSGGKKNAIAQGIKTARYDNIITVDGDCHMGPNWLKEMDASIDEDTWLATGRVDIDPVDSVIAAYEYYDTIATMAATNLGIVNRYFYLANGCNLYFKKELFNQVASDPIYLRHQSGDDVFLIKKAVELGKKVAFIKSEGAIMSTYPQKSISALMSQRKRWSTKSKSYASVSLLLLQGFVWGYVTLIFIFILASIWYLPLMLAGITLLLIKLVGDGIFFKSMNVEGKMNYYLPASFLYLLMITKMGFYALFPSKFSWKGRTEI